MDNENGGFRSDFGRDWKPGPRSEGKFSVFQGRMTWIASQVAMRRPEMKDRFLPIAQHGLDYLNNTLWDKQYGGFYWGLDDKAQISPFYTDGKHLYGISFGIYGAAAAYGASKDPKALELAQKAFRWVDEHAHIVPVHHQTCRLSDEPLNEPLERLEQALVHEPERLALKRVGDTFICPAG